MLFTHFYNHFDPFCVHHDILASAWSLITSIASWTLSTYLYLFLSCFNILRFFLTFSTKSSFLLFIVLEPEHKSVCKQRKQRFTRSRRPHRLFDASISFNRSSHVSQVQYGRVGDARFVPVPRRGCRRLPQSLSSDVSKAQHFVSLKLTRFPVSVTIY